ncbi:Protein kinase C-like phorbol ester/diacylglycerol-binding domain [Arabidopsis thaliana x Arabidopsis arenosa]|uniref:Protein kinase C-like phorbol ester/diacylglycerol-binding domain n=1 Tax=Arabidopsis thaliana x Arabidopsis arenosa TaxID=1240361 RepID=A0A8T1ZJP6_9BRAS|nr:Protein kinase C-like phorbol ester/diacylglycerol-binding domain [Arabidopsis thaliana x Arabidopsis arenosa]
MTFELTGHEHRVSVVNHRDGLECDVCDRLYGDAYSCGECKFTVHVKCAFVFQLNDIFEHPSHDGHCLKLLTTGAPDHTNLKCHLCGKNTKRLLHHCSTCRVNLHIDCMLDSFVALYGEKFTWHTHPLFKIDLGAKMGCAVCGVHFYKGYFCYRCRLMVHGKCTSLIESPEITHPCHAKHSLKLLTEGAPDYTDPKCHLCGEDTGKFIYHCDICKFNLDLVCATEKPPPAYLSNLKVHEHTVTLMARLISFDCDACGKKGDRAPYVCVQCDFMIHLKCANLPRVIHINHHDHRVAYKYPLGFGEWRCGVCWEEIDWSYGAYSCSLCPGYALHSLCATRGDVWDGKELDGVPEEFEDIEPFKWNDDNTITHFTHEHNLMSIGKDSEERNLCGACVRPIGSYTFYKCSESECNFMLHETCANLPKKKRHFLSPLPLSLHLQTNHEKETCKACHQVCCEGFIYSAHHEYYLTFDLICSSITVPFIHGSHDHHLLYLKLPNGQVKTCQNCGMDEKEVVIGCKKCDYFLDFRCASLPLTVTLPRYDDHPLTLCYGDEKASGKYWCDICERETNPKTWFYTCKDCGITLHVFCVVGDIRYAKPKGKIDDNVELLANNSSSRPLCNTCRCRCPGLFILKTNLEGKNVLFCSYYCLRLSLGHRDDKCPPWAIESNTYFNLIFQNLLRTS